MSLAIFQKDVDRTPHFGGSRVFIFEKFFPLGANLGGASWDLLPQKH